MSKISNIFRTILAQTKQLRGRSVALYAVVGLALFTVSTTATNAYITGETPREFLVRLTGGARPADEEQKTPVLGVVVEDNEEEVSPIEEVENEEDEPADTTPNPTVAPVSAAPTTPATEPVDTTGDTTAPDSAPDSDTQDGTQDEPQQPDPTPEPEPEPEEDDTEDALDDGTRDVLMSILFKMQRIRSDIKLYQKWRSEAVERKLNCRENILDDYDWSPAIEDIIKECQENEQKRIDDYDNKINELKRELNEYERQKNDIIIGCQKCADFWNASVAELQRRGLW